MLNIKIWSGTPVGITTSVPECLPTEGGGLIALHLYPLNE